MKKKELKKAVEELTEAIRLTQEYIDLPALEGWSWYDALKKYAPEKAERLRARQQHPSQFFMTNNTATGSSSSCTVSGCRCRTTWVTNYEVKDEGE